LLDWFKGFRKDVIHLATENCNHSGKATFNRPTVMNFMTQKDPEWILTLYLNTLTLSRQVLLLSWRQ